MLLQLLQTDLLPRIFASEGSVTLSFSLFDKLGDILHTCCVEHAFPARDVSPASEGVQRCALQDVKNA